MTVLEMITSALRLLGAVAAGDQINDSEAADGLITLNALLDAWRTQHPAIFTIENNSFNLVAGKGDYTIGSGGELAASRPVKIQSANVVIGTLAHPVELINSIRYAQIPEKSVQGLRPLYLYNDNDYPLAMLHLWPVPIGVSQLQLFAWHELPQFTDVAQTIDLPPGYLKAIRFALAIEIASEYGRPVDASVVQTAERAKAALAGLMNSNAVATEDPPVPAQVQQPIVAQQQ